jgi:hypothetical protein
MERQTTKEEPTPVLTFYLFPFFSLFYFFCPAWTEIVFCRLIRPDGFGGCTPPLIILVTQTDTIGCQLSPARSDQKEFSTHKWMAAVQLYHYAPASSITVDQQFHKFLRLFETFGLRVPAGFFFLYKRANEAVQHIVCRDFWERPA